MREAARAMRIRRGGGTQRCEALSAGAMTRGCGQTKHHGLSTPMSLAKSSRLGGKSHGKVQNERRKIVITSRWAAICERRYGPLREIVIGRAHAVIARRPVRGNGVVRDRRALALLHQPAREHGGGVLLDPLIEQRANLPAEIGGVAEARKLVALQRGARSGEQEFPRGLRFMNGQEGPPEGSGVHNSSNLIHCNSTSG